MLYVIMSHLTTPILYLTLLVTINLVFGKFTATLYYRAVKPNYMY